MLEKLRRDHGLTQQQLAEAAGCQRTSISMYENGKGHPRFPVARRLASVLHTTIDELFRDTPPAAEEPADVEP